MRSFDTKPPQYQAPIDYVCLSGGLGVKKQPNPSGGSSGCYRSGIVAARYRRHLDRGSENLSENLATSMPLVAQLLV